MIARVKIYIIIGLIATASFLGLYVKILNQDLKQYQELEKKESKKQKLDDAEHKYMMYDNIMKSNIAMAAAMAQSQQNKCQY